MVRVPDGGVRILVQGRRRVRLGPYTQTEPFLVAHVEEMPDRAERTTEVEALARNLQGVFTRMIELVPHLPDELQIAVANLEDPTTLSYLISASIRLSVEERQELLEEVDLEARLRRLTVLCTRELELLELGAKIQSDVQLDLEQGPARVLPAPAAQGDPRGARRGRRRPAPRSRSCASARPRPTRRSRCARPPSASSPRLERLPPGVGRARGRADLHRLDPRRSRGARPPRTTST